MDFSGTTAVVTGAASGMGRATAVGFANAGANVALLDINSDGAQEVANQIDRTGTRVVVYPVDTAQPSEVAAALHGARDRFGRLDAVANVAAIYPKARVLEVTEAFWDQVVSINLRGVFFCCQEAIRIMLYQGKGAIVNVASGAAFRAIEGHSAYSAAKAGLVGFSRVLALECARQGIRVNVVAPGHTRSETAVRALGPEQVEAMAATLVPGRFMTP